MVPFDLTGIEVQFHAGFVDSVSLADPLAFDRLAPLFENEPVTTLRLLNHRGLDLARLAALQARFPARCDFSAPNACVEMAARARTE